MKNLLTYLSVVLFCTLFYSFTGLNVTNTDATDNVVIQFVTTNQYGNNLYIDNVAIGSQFGYDIMVTSINNIPSDTNYSFYGSSNFNIAPKVSFTNVGRNNVSSSFNVTMTINPGSYTSTKSIPSLNSGQSYEVTFDNATISPNVVLTLRAYSSLSSDQNRSNDTLQQNSLFLPGVKRNVLFEAYTQTNCGPCASNNPALDAFISARFDTIVAIKHHVWWPGANNDPMYLANVSQNNDRINYYSINAVPTLMVDGVIKQVSGYTTLSNLLNPYNNRLAKGSPLSLNVVDTRIAGDSIKANITMTIYSPLSVGNYYLRVEAIERTITYSSPPGTNGETIFHDVFRRAYPNTMGTTIPMTPGTYNYEFRYKRETAWVDSMIYTSVFVQNETNKEVINCAKARHYVSDKDAAVIQQIPLKPYAEYNGYELKPQVTFGTGDLVTGGYVPELFEGSFPPSGWTIINPDNGITFEKFVGANGPSLGGNSSSRLNFYSYSSTGQMDYMKTKVFNSVENNDTISFDWAYAMYSSSYLDRLQVMVSTNGGSSFPYTIFDRSGSALATAPTTTSDFVPTNSQWATFKIAFANVVSVKPVSEPVPDSYELSQNYPNPFNPVTTIKFALPKDGLVNIKVYNAAGGEVAEVYNGILKAGVYTMSIDGTKWASGVYFCRISAPGFTDTKKMILVK
jgi:hypothetical protein